MSGVGCGGRGGSGGERGGEWGWRRRGSGRECNCAAAAVQGAHRYGVLVLHATEGKCEYFPVCFCVQVVFLQALRPGGSVVHLETS